VYRLGRRGQAVDESLSSERGAPVVFCKVHDAGFKALVRESVAPIEAGVTPIILPYGPACGCSESLRAIWSRSIWQAANTAVARSRWPLLRILHTRPSCIPAQHREQQRTGDDQENPRPSRAAHGLSKHAATATVLASTARTARWIESQKPDGAEPVFRNNSLTPRFDKLSANGSGS
jgi:hypothetical protein